MTARKNGFTLIELMVAIAIIAILSAVGLVVYSTAQRSARISKRQQDLNALNTAIELFRSTNGFYPSVTTAGTFVCANTLSGNNSLSPAYIAIVPADPSGIYCYEYTSDGAGANPLGTQFKIKTDDTIPTTEMGFADYNRWDSRLDPAKDGSIGSGSTACNVNPLTVNVTGQAWAYYTGNTVTCLY